MSSVASLLDSQLTPKQQQLLTAILYPVIRQDLNEAATWSQWSSSPMRGAESVGDIGRTFGVGRSTLYRLWSSAGELPDVAMICPDCGAHR